MISLAQIRRWLGRHRRDVAAVAAIALLAIVVLALTHQWWDEIFHALQHTNPVLCFVLACLLPLAGCSITLIYLVAGARFGGAAGIAFMAAATVVHLAGTHLIANSMLRGPLDRLMKRRGYHLPQAVSEKPASFALLAALVPGPPYFARNYLLALSGVPLRVYFFACWPVYVARSCVAIVFGDWGKDLTPTRIAILAGVLLLKIGICALLLRNLYRRRGDRRVAAARSRPRTRPA